MCVSSKYINSLSDESFRGVTNSTAVNLESARYQNKKGAPCLRHQTDPYYRIQYKTHTSRAIY